MGEIAAASQEQAQGIEQVNTAVSQMDKVTQQNAGNAEESASASEELNAQAESMKDAVNELVKLVEGNSNVSLSVNKAGTGTGRKKKLGSSDHVFHRIADEGAGESPAKVKAGASSSIPLDDEDLKDFNS